MRHGDFTIEVNSKDYHLDGFNLSDSDVRRISDAYQLIGNLIIDINYRYCEKSLKKSRLEARHFIDWLPGDVRRTSDFFDCILMYCRDCEPGLCENPNLNIIQIERLTHESWHSAAFAGLRTPLYNFFCNRTGSTFYPINVLCQFIKRLTLQDLVDLDDSMIDDYKTQEVEMLQWTYPSDICDQLREIISERLMPFVDYSLLAMPHEFSTGACVELTRTNCNFYNKYGLVVPPRACRNSLMYTRPRFRLSLKKRAKRWTYSKNKCLSWKRSEPAVVKIVPKSMTKKRVISKEQVFDNYVQISTKILLQDAFEKSPLNICLTDQSYNTELARLGSMHRNYATIDLSAASDSVTMQLIDKIIPSPLLELLRSSRNPTVILPDGTALDICKFGGMGSGTTFPVECLVFASIIELANKLKGKRTYYRVYGDDMICHKTVYDEVVSILADLHFKVNEEKSYAPDHWFKESCGGEYYDGFDVTPMRIGRRYDVAYDRRDRESLAQYLKCTIQMINKCYNEYFLCTRKYLIVSLINGIGQKYLTYGPESRKNDSSWIFSPGYDVHVRKYKLTRDGVTRTIWDQTEERLTESCLQPVSQARIANCASNHGDDKTKTSLREANVVADLDNIRYIRWLMSHVTESSGPGFKSDLFLSQMNHVEIRQIHKISLYRPTEPVSMLAPSELRWCKKPYIYSDCEL